MTNNIAKMIKIVFKLFFIVFIILLFPIIGWIVVITHNFRLNFPNYSIFVQILLGESLLIGVLILITLICLWYLSLWGD